MAHAWHLKESVDIAELHIWFVRCIEVETDL